MCLTCRANVRTPLNSPLVGAKLYLAAGMSSARGTISRSAVRNWPSSVWPMLGASAAEAAAASKTAQSELIVVRIILLIYHHWPGQVKVESWESRHLSKGPAFCRHRPGHWM